MSEIFDLTHFSPKKAHQKERQGEVHTLQFFTTALVARATCMLLYNINGNSITAEKKMKQPQNNSTTD